VGKGMAAGIKQGSGGGIDWAECEPAAGGSGKDVKGIGGAAIEGEKDGLRLEEKDRWEKTQEDVMCKREEEEKLN